MLIYHKTIFSDNNHQSDNSAGDCFFTLLYSVRRTAGGEKQECQLVAIQPLAEQVGEETKIKLIVRMQPPVGDEDYQEAF